MFRAGAQCRIKGFCRDAVLFCRDRRGIAAIEFAFIAPLLLVMYFMTMEVSQGVETSKKVNRIGSMVADLVTQQQDTTIAKLNAIMKIGNTALRPYNRSSPSIVISQISISTDATPKIKVDWGRRMIDGVFSADPGVGKATTLPAALIQPGTYVIRVQSFLDYRPVITWAADGKKEAGLTSAFDSLSLGETYYLRPRMSKDVKCTDC